MSIGDLYHQLSQRTLWIVGGSNGRWLVGYVSDWGPKFRYSFATEAEANAKRDELAKADK